MNRIEYPIKTQSEYANTVEEKTLDSPLLHKKLSVPSPACRADLRSEIMNSNNPIRYSKELEKHIKTGEQLINQKIQASLSSIQSEDIQRILRAGFDPTKMTRDLLFQVGNSAAIGKRLRLDAENNRTVTVDESKINSLLKSFSENNTLINSGQKQIEQIVGELKARGLDVNLSNIEKVSKYTNKVDKIKNMSNQKVIDFLKSGTEPTIANLVKSVSGQGGQARNRIREADYQAIAKTVERLVDQHFGDKEQYPDKKQVADLAKEIVKKGIPLDQKALAVIGFVKANTPEREHIHQAINQLVTTGKPEEYSILDKSESKRTAAAELKTIVAKFKEIPNTAISSCLCHNKTVNYQNLIMAATETEQQPKLSQEQRSEYLRQVEDLNVIRYHMTYRSALVLEANSIDLGQAGLQTIRRSLEQLWTATPNTAEREPTSLEPDNSLKQTQNQELIQISRHLSRISGSASLSIAEVAITYQDRIQSQSAGISIEMISGFARAGLDRYDQLTTQPRPELGDSYAKAFRTIAPILAELGLEDSESNNRSAQILAYNQMPLTLENINSVRYVDTVLQNLFSTLLPSHIRELLHKKVDILNEPIENLLAFTKERSQAMKTDIKSRIIQQINQLEKTNQDKERESVMGLYKMINTIVREKDRAVGYLLDKQLPVNLENLFDATRYIRKRPTKQSNYVDVAIGQEFGFLEQIRAAGKTIKQQIQSGYSEKEQTLDRYLTELLETEPEQSLRQIRQQQESQKINQKMEAVCRFDKDLDGLSEANYRRLMRFNPALTPQDWQSYKPFIQGQETFGEFFRQLWAETTDSDMKSRLQQEMERYLSLPNEQHLAQLGQVVKQMVDRNMERQITGRGGTEKEAKTKRSIQMDANEANTKLDFMSRLMNQENYYAIPVWINGQIQQMTMYYGGESEKTGQAKERVNLYFSLQTTNLGKINIKAVLDQAEARVMTHLSEPNKQELLIQALPELENIFAEIGFQVSGIKYQEFSIPQPIVEHKTDLIKKYAESQYEKTV